MRFQIGARGSVPFPVRHESLKGSFTASKDVLSFSYIPCRGHDSRYEKTEAIDFRQFLINLEMYCWSKVSLVHIRLFGRP